MIYVLYALFILACIVLVVSILLQPGKADAGALFTNSISTTAFGPRGTQTLLSKITIGAAAVFMLIAFIMSLPIATGTRSVLETQSAPAATPTPAATPQTQPSANAATPQAAASPQASAAPSANPSPSSATNAKAGAPKGQPSPSSQKKR